MNIPFIEKVFAQNGGALPGGADLTGTNIAVPQPDQFKITNIGALVSAATSALLIFAALAAFIFLVLGGLQWITSGGDKAGMEAARNKITHAIVGLIIVAAAYAIMILVGNFLGFGFLSGGSFDIKKPFTQ